MKLTFQVMYSQFQFVLHASIVINEQAMEANLVLFIYL